MEAFMKKSSYIFIVLMALTIVIFVSCEESFGTTNLHLTFSSDRGQSSSREVVSPVGQSLAITGYIVSGNGPNDKSFSITTNSSQADINGLVIGTWEINVIGINQQGTAIASGNKIHHLTTKSNNIEIILDELTGSGSVDVGFYWVDTNYPELDFSLVLKPQNGIEREVTEGLFINHQTASARFQATLETGSYDLIFSLTSGDENIAGGVVVLRILDGFTSSKEITLIVDKETRDASTFLIKNSVVEPVVGTIEGLSSTLLPMKRSTAHFSHTAGGGSGLLTVNWYLDGIAIGSGLSVDFIPHSGNHRLDAVASTPNIGSVGATTFPFRATVEPMDGVPVIVSNHTQGDKDQNNKLYNLNGVSATAFLKDGKLLVAATNSLQLCEIKKDRLVVLKTYTSSGSMPATSNPYPVEDISSIVVDNLDNLVITTSKTRAVVTLYKYDQDQQELVKVSALEKIHNAPWENNILDAQIDRINKRLYILDPNKSKMYYSSYGLSGIDDLNNITVSKCQQASSFSVTNDGSIIAIASSANRKLVTYNHTFALDLPLNVRFNVYGETFFDESQIDASNFAIWAVGPTIHINLNDGLYLLTPPTESATYWQQTNKITSKSGPASCITYDSLLANCWFVEGSSTPVITKSEMTSGIPMNPIGSTNLETFKPNYISYSPKGTFLALSGNNRLMLLRIADD
jgi:hypothetical protein